MATNRYSSFDVEVPRDTATPFKRFSDVSDLVASCFMCLFCIINMIMLMVVLFSHSFKITSDFSNLIPMMEYISLNLNAGPIMSISLPVDGVCPLYSEADILDTWPGTVTGCYCSKRGTLYAGECLRSDAGVCNIIRSVNPQAFRIWNSEIYCIRRALPVNYYFKNNFNVCAKDYNDCGIVCVQGEDKCPIAKVYINQTNINDEGNSSSDEKLNLTQGRVMIIDRNTAENTLFNLKISLNNMPCLQPGYYPTYNGSNYPLLNIENHQGCGDLGVDSSAFFLESSQFSIVFNQNQMTDVENLPLYLKSEEGAENFLVSVPRISILKTDECLALNGRQSGSIKDSINTFKNWTIGGTTLSVIAIIVYWGYLIYLLFDEGLKKFFKKATSKWLSWILFTLCFAVVVIYSRSLSRKNQEVLVEQHLYLDLGSSNCFQNANISLAFITFAEHITNVTATVMNFVTAIFWISVFFYVTTFITAGYALIYKTCCS